MRAEVVGLVQQMLELLQVVVVQVGQQALEQVLLEQLTQAEEVVGAMQRQHNLLLVRQVDQV
jgi:hypothetical protein